MTTAVRRRHAPGGLPLFAALLVTLLLGTAPAAAQEVEPVEGAADFRTAPLVGDGRYRDMILTGESLWFTVLYRNEEEIDFAASLVGAVEGGDDLQLTTTLVSPTLETADQYPDRRYKDFRYGDADVHPWHVRVDLTTDGRLGVPHEYELQLSGFEDPGLADQAAAARTLCTQDPDCNLDERLAALQPEVDGIANEVSSLEEQLRDAAPSQAEVAAEVTALENRITILDDELSATSPVRQVPTAAWLVFTALLIATVTRIVISVRQRPVADEDEPRPDDPEVIVIDVASVDSSGQAIDQEPA